MEALPKVLVISYNCFSTNRSNGITLSNLFYGWDMDKIAQIYMCKEVPNNDICTNYFRITDEDVLRALFFKKAGNKIELFGQEQDSKGLFNDIYKNALSKRSNFKYKALRDVLWKISPWKSKKLTSFIDDFQPGVIVTMAGDNTFVDRLVVWVAKKYNLPVVVFNCEDYHLKKMNESIWHRYLRRAIRKSYKELMKYSKWVVYNSQELLNDYKEFYNGNASVIYNSAPVDKDFNGNINKKDNNPLKIVYIGNLGLGRHESLIEIAKAVNELMPETAVEIYGPCQLEIEKEFAQCPYIKYMGTIPADIVNKTLINSDIVLHAENFDEFIVEDIKHGFTTKIPQVLSSGVCFFVYASDKIVSIKYLKDNDAACVAASKEELKEKLKEVLFSQEKRIEYAKKGLQLAAKNHNIEKNSKAFRDILIQVASKTEN